MKAFYYLLTVTACCSLILIAGCETGGQTGALLGSGIGAGVGALAGGDTEATLIGAAVGGGAGYIIGNESDKKKQKQEMQQVREDMNCQTVYVTNSNGSVIPVKLRRSGPDWVGPRGELYRNGLPNSATLKPVYGF